MKTFSFPRRIGLFFKIGLMVLVLLTTAIGITTLVSIKEQTKTIKTELIEKNKTISKHLASSARNAFWSLNWLFVERQMQEATRSGDVISLEIVKPNGEVYMTCGDVEWKKNLSTAELMSQERQTVKDVICPKTGKIDKLIITPIEIGSERWSLVMALCLKRVQEARDIILEKDIRWGIIIFLFAMLVSFLFTRGIIKPIWQLVEGTKEIAKGNLDHRMKIEGRDEIGELAEAFNEMIKDLKRARDEGKGLQENLEQMVEDRTRELKETQKELVSKAMEAGRAQWSAVVLHNIGNAITPLKVHMEQMKASELKQIPHYLDKCYLDLSEHATDLQRYVNNDPRGKEVFSYMGKLVDSLKDHGDHLVGVTKDMDAAVSYISEILTLQHAYTAREQETKERTDLNSLIEDATRMQAGALEKRGISVKEDLDHNIPKLLIDKNRLMQVMVNLIKNSYEAIDELKDGSKERVISIKSFAEDGDVGFEITDNGIGIEPEDMESIFEFGKSHKGSLGVGLYYSKMFVEVNKGRLHISSAGRGKGATVRVMFETGNPGPDLD